MALGIAPNAWGQTVKATLTNGTAAGVFLGGCGAYAVERKEAGTFVDKGTTVDCVWEGYANEVKPGAIKGASCENGSCQDL